MIFFRSLPKLPVSILLTGKTALQPCFSVFHKSFTSGPAKRITDLFTTSKHRLCGQSTYLIWLFRAMIRYIMYLYFTLQKHAMTKIRLTPLSRESAASLPLRLTLHFEGLLLRLPAKQSKQNDTEHYINNGGKLSWYAVTLTHYDSRQEDRFSPLIKVTPISGFSATDDCTPRCRLISVNGPRAVWHSSVTPQWESNTGTGSKPSVVGSNGYRYYHYPSVRSLGAVARTKKS